MKNFPISARISALVSTTLLFPVSTFAFDLPNSTFKGIICEVVGILNLIIPILVGVALIFFFWGLTKFLINSSGNAKELDQGKSYMFWGILALFILFTFRAIIGIVTNQFEFGRAQGFPYLPTDKGQSNTSYFVCQSADVTIGTTEVQ